MDNAINTTGNIDWTWTEFYRENYLEHDGPLVTLVVGKHSNEDKPRLEVMMDERLIDLNYANCASARFSQKDLEYFNNLLEMFCK